MIALFVAAASAALLQQPASRPAHRAPAAAHAPHAARAQDTVVVYKTPTCGCCRVWVDSLRAAGFAVQAHDMDDLSPILARYHVGQALESCHTAIVGGYVVEGHVPPDLIARMLREKPHIAGLAIPGMPQAAPGMDNHAGGPYTVLAFTADGRTTPYATRR